LLGKPTKEAGDMNRRLFIRITTPAALLGLALFAVCLVAVWYVNRLERGMAHILSQNVTSLEAAQELEIRVRQLRSHCFLYLVEPTPERLEPIEADNQAFEEALRTARHSAMTAEERASVQAIDEGYHKYRDELAQLREDVKNKGPRTDFGKLSDNHPIRHLTAHCHELLRLNKAEMQDTARENERISRQATLLAVLLGIGGPIGGVLIGYNVARGLSRSIYSVSVRVQDIAQRLDAGMAAVRVTVDDDIEDLDQQVSKVVARVEEVSERLQRHRGEMLRAEQLAAVGQLAAGVAHEIRNPLTSIKLLVEAALRPKQGMPLTAEDLEVIHGEVTRLEQTVQDFLDFARPPAFRPAPCDLAQVISQAMELVRVRARQQGVAFSTQVRDRLGTAPLLGPAPGFGDAMQLRTVLVNLFLNALDAMPGGGRLEVTLAPASPRAISLTVTDTGPGIPPEMGDRLFTPFASSKPTGTGLGLSISRRIVEEHGGTIAAVNHAEGGACFTITLPLPVGADAPVLASPVLSKEATHADPAGH